LVVLFCCCLTLLPIHGGKSRADLQSPSWWDPDGIGAGHDWHYRVPIQIQGGEAGERIVVDVDFGPGAGSLLETLGVSGDFDENSPRVVKEDSSPLAQQQFDDGCFEGGSDPVGNGRGRLLFTLEEDAPVTYYLYFDIAENGAKPAPSFEDPAVLTNGGFETGDLTGWVGGGDGAHQVSDAVVHDGSYAALIGFRDADGAANSYDYIYQTITVPPSGGTLSFWYRFLTYDSSHWDDFEAWIRDEDGSNLERIAYAAYTGAYGSFHDLGWQQVEFDLASYAGQTIQLYFQVSNRYDTLYRSWAYVDSVSVGLEPTVAILGLPQGFGLEITTLVNESDPSGPFRCTNVVGIYARSDVGLYLDNSTGRTLEAQIEDADGTNLGSVTLYDDGAHGDATANDGTWTNSVDFAIPSHVGSNGGSWQVTVRAGSSSSGYDNGYLVVDGEHFVVEGVRGHPDPLSLSVCQGGLAQVLMEMDNLGQAALDPVQARMIGTLSDGAGHTITDTNVSFSLGSGVQLPAGTVNYPMTVTVTADVGQTPGVYTGTLAVYEDINGNDVVDDCIQSSHTLVVTVEDCGSVGAITPSLHNATLVQPCPCEGTHPVFYVYNFENQNSAQDRANLSLKPPSSQGWKVAIYKDINGDTLTGTYTITPTNFSDDVLLAYDNDGDGGSGGWDYVNPTHDTGSDNIPDTGDLAAYGAPGDNVNLTLVVYVPCSALAGTVDTTTLRGSSHNDWQANHPTAPYDDDAVFHDFAIATTNVDASPCGIITPRDLSQAVDPCRTLYFVQKWQNLGAAADRGNISIESNPAGFPISVYRDAGLDDTPGVYDSAAWQPDPDDHLIARDTDGDGSWDYVHPAYDTGGDGVPDTGDLSPHGGYTHLIVAVEIPCNCTFDVVWPGDYDLLVRGSSNNDWVNNHPSQSYNDDAVYHDEVTNQVTVNSKISLSLTSDGEEEANPGQAANHQMAIDNRGNVTDTVNFTVTASYNFTVTLYETGGITPLIDHTGDSLVDLTVPPCASVGFQAVISIPIETGGGVSQTTVITATSISDASISDTTTLTTTATARVDGLIEPGYIESTVTPGYTAYYCQVWTNRGNVDDRGNISIYPTQGWPVQVYLDVEGDDPQGVLSGLDGDDVLIAEDADGDGTWDSVTPAYDTGGDGIPDTGPLAADPDGPGPQTGGSVHLVFAVTVPRTTASWIRNGLLVRGSSQYDWETRRPTLSYNDEEIFHDESLISALAGSHLCWMPLVARNHSLASQGAAVPGGGLQEMYGPQDAKMVPY
jgi:hypothetical protein